MAPLNFHHLSARSLSTGATVGAALGGAAAAILFVVLLVFLSMSYRNRHAATTAEKPSDTKQTKRCGSCKRPQNHPRPPKAAKLAREVDAEDERRWQEELTGGKAAWLSKPWLNSSRASLSPSFSSKRATRMMMIA